MRLPILEHVALLTDSQTWGDNPFVRRDARRDRKRQQPWRSFLWMSGTLLVFGCLGLWGLFGLNRVGLANAWFVGDDVGTALCILLCGLHIYYVVGASQKHTMRMLQEEISRTTLSSLLLLPSTPFQLVLQSMVYPWLVGMRAALVLLPLYALCIGLGGVTWFDILLLYVVFALSAVTIPRWNRPVLNEAVAVSTPTAEPVTFASRSAANPAANQNWSGAFGSWTAASCLFLFWVVISSRVNPGVAYELTSRYAPDSIIKLLPLSFLSWPLLLARGLVTPFDWFGYALPPLPFTLLLFLGSRYTQVVRVSEWLQVGLYRDLALLPTYMPRRRLEGALMIAQVFVWTGYLWRWGVVDGGLSGMAGAVGPPDALGLPGFVFGLLFVTLYWRGLARAGALAEWSRPLPRRGVLRATPRFTSRTAVSYLGKPLVFAALYYLACCYAAHTPPFPPGILPLAGKMLAVGISCWLLRYGVTYFVRPLVYVGIAIPLGMQMLALTASQYRFPPNLKLLTYFSPYLGLVNLGSHSLLGFDVRWALQSGFSWQGWLLYSGLPGLVLTLLVGLLALVRSRRAVGGGGDSRLSINYRSDVSTREDLNAGQDTVILDPTLVGREAFLDVTVAQAANQAQTEAPLARALIRGAQAVYDNAVLTRELRSRLRGKLQTGALQRTFLIYLCITLALVYGAPQMAISLGESMANSLFPDHAQTQSSACVLSLWYLALFATVPFVGASMLPAAYAIEYEKSTLGFTLTTPISSFAITAGKALGLLLTGCLTQALIAFWTLGLSLILASQLGLGHALLIWCSVVLSVGVMTVTIGLIALAVASLFPKRLTVKAGSVVQGLMIYALFFAPSGFHYLRDQLMAWTGLDGAALWLALLVGCSVLSALALAVATFGVRRMRKSDVVFASTKRDN